ncbi:enkurin domain-containing protein 1 isoform X2 [Cetorhinus maximus]
MPERSWREGKGALLVCCCSWKECHCTDHCHQKSKLAGSSIDRHLKPLMENHSVGFGATNSRYFWWRESCFSVEKETRDHEKENVRRMREIQKKCREKDQERELNGPKPVKALWKSQKYESIPSKVMAQLQESSPVKHSESQQYLKAHSRCGAGVCPKRSSSPSPPKPEHCAEAAEDANTEIQVKGVNVDFVRHNAQNARRMPVRRSKSLQSLADVLDKKTKEQQEYISKNKGQLPQYLIERRDQWRKEAEERRKNIPDPSMPPGHTRMPENERLETLNSLQQTQKQLTKQLLMFPVRVDTIGMRNRRTDLERKLAEIEEAIKIFSRPKVFIKTND